jgi:hypothetical protein
MVSFDKDNKEGKSVHNIPTLAPAIQQKLNELWKAGE